MSSVFRHQFRVRYAEVDPQAVVFNSRYLEYADLLVSEYFRDRRAAGMPEGLDFHIRHAELDYREPIRLEELIDGRASVDRIGGSSMTMRVELHGTVSGENDLRAVITLVQVHVDLASGRPLRIPDALRQAFGHPTGEPAHG